MTDENLPIGVMDSGIGGLTVAKELISILPNEDIIYFGDSKRMPYGNKSVEEIIYLANTIIEFLESKGVKAILLACNTVSSQIENLKHQVPLFGIIDAGCKAIIETSKSQEIGLIATVATVKSKVYEDTLKRVDKRVNIISNDSRKLPKIINDQLERRDLLDTHIKQCIDPILSKGNIKELILGCSHFPIIEEEIQELYPHLKLINPAQQQVSMLKQYLESKELLKNKTAIRNVDIYATSGLNEFKLILNRLEVYDYSLSKVKLFKKD